MLQCCSMDVQKFTADELQEHYKNSEVIQKTVTQINKDISGFGEFVEVDEYAGNAYAELMDKMTAIIVRMLKHNSDQLFALLYKVDVSENRVNNILSNPVDHIRELSRILIEREVVKVLTKAFFRP